MRTIKGWLDYLFYDIGKQNFDFYLCKLTKTYCSKWRRYSEAIFPIDFNEDWKILRDYNQRQIFPNEVVLDIEDKEKIDGVIAMVEACGYMYYLYETGSRGYHIHLWFDKDLTIEEKDKIVGLFGADLHKISQKSLIALENAPHWKSGKLKRLIKSGS